MVEQFWSGMAQTRQMYKDRVKLVTFNGRGFDMPLLEMAAFRYGCQASEHFQNRNRYTGSHLDLMDWLSNFGALRMAGGLDVSAKLLGKPRKTSCTGDQVYQMLLDGKLPNQRLLHVRHVGHLLCFFAVWRVLVGSVTLEKEHQLVMKAKEFVRGQVDQFPALQEYLDNWGDWNPWP